MSAEEEAGANETPEPSPMEGDGGLLTQLLARISNLERQSEIAGRREKSPRRSKKVLGQSSEENSLSILKSAKRDHTLIQRALGKARKPFDKPILSAFRAPEKEKETANFLKAILSDSIRVLPSLSAIADRLEAICDENDVDQETWESLVEVKESVIAVMTLMTVESHSIRMRLWRNTASAVAPSLNNTTVDSLIAKSWKRDDFQNFVADLLKAETANSMIESNRSIARVMQGHNSRAPQTPKGPSKAKWADQASKPDHKSKRSKAAQPTEAAADGK